MKTQHSLISPSNFERRMLCPGSLNAEKDLPDVYSKYAEEGKLLHEKTIEYIGICKQVYRDEEKYGYIWEQSSLSSITDEQEKCLDELNKEQQEAVIRACEYYFSFWNKRIMYAPHEQTYDLSFIYPGMKGTADSILIIDNTRNEDKYEIHIIDYKFGKGVSVQAYQNYQLILYYLGAINDPEIKHHMSKHTKISVHLHIVQPFRNNSVWDLTDDEVLEINNLNIYLDVVNKCYSSNAIRIPHKKACQFCKAKPTCPALAKTVPNPDIDFFGLEDTEIAAIYDNRELISMYMSSIEQYITNRINDGGFENYALVNKMSNRKWNNEALIELKNILGDEAFETTTKLIPIGKAEKLVGKDSDIINKLVTREVTGVEIVKYHSIKDNNINN